MDSQMRQAVLIIHGIGEQRPMEMLREFARVVLPDSLDGTPQFWTKPDTITDSFELWRLVSTDLPIQTDFYEFYWAHHMQGTNIWHVAGWLRYLLLRNPRNIPTKLRILWGIIWALLIAGGLLFLAQNDPGTPLEGQNLRVMAVAVVVAFVLINFVILQFVGDAARYLYPAPTNIAQRQKIRAAGTRILRNLHDSGKYERIIVVGHSLGSIIAYDIIKHAWVEYNATHHEPDELRQTALKHLEHTGLALDGHDEPSPEAVDAFRDAQEQLWLENRRAGNRWLVTDLITLGSPLAYAQPLLASTKRELGDLIRQRELPTCPPEPERAGQDLRYAYCLSYETQRGPREIEVLHHAAVYACTRWTNLYYPGDYIGGPLAGIFGSGIKDVEIADDWRHKLPVLPHVWYWAKTKHNHTAIHALIDALALPDEEWHEAMKKITQELSQVKPGDVTTQKTQKVDDETHPRREIHQGRG